jgi:hypothetical protein
LRAVSSSSAAISASSFNLAAVISSPSALAWHEEIIDNLEDEQCQQKPVEYRFPFAFEKLVCVHFPFASASGVKMSYEPPTGLTVRRLRGFLKRKIRDWMAPMERFIV